MSNSISSPLLLSQSASIESKQHPLPPPLPLSLDETMERCIGDFSWVQFLQAFLLSFAWFFDAQQTLSVSSLMLSPSGTVPNSVTSHVTRPPSTFVNSPTTHGPGFSCAHLDHI
ncbi:hypothetical protein Ddye_014310 [Dipteronia dyeriana]|uniref:Uncharacterized protein n=1 Tax=Dipteronia dyeriana TaxID=168575 RepID=A0AAD9X7V9_9ROSI|nr:hypothetical protein Ddye_014310 [Dipteronia dyeriana]